MTSVIIFFAFAMSLIINLLEKKIKPGDQFYNGKEFDESEAVKEAE